MDTSTNFQFIPNQKYTYCIENKLLLHIQCITCCVSKLYFTNELNQTMTIPENIELYLHNIPCDIESFLGGNCVDFDKNKYIIPKQENQFYYILDFYSYIDWLLVLVSLDKLTFLLFSLLNFQIRHATKY